MCPTIDERQPQGGRDQRSGSDEALAGGEHRRHHARVRGDLPSVTAVIVAFARAAATLAPMTTPRFEDGVASGLLPFGMWRLVQNDARFARERQGLLRVLSVGLVDHLALRSLAIDEAVLASGAEQIVILGAGLDARASRLPRADGVRFFEVDHPNSQRWKQARLAAREGRGTRPPHATEYVAVDFTNQSLADALVAAGFAPARSSMFVWEGVTMYLPREATVQTLRDIARLASPGGRVALTYMETPSRPIPASLRVLLDAALGVVGEPLGATYAPEEMRQLLASHGFARLSDAASDEWAATYRGNATLGRAFRAERLAVSVRTG